ncbi:MAG: ATP-binding protein, partial [Acidobacteria bacterium]|nr:ATP-binding protein [Acidobacteriota bacterium]
MKINISWYIIVPLEKDMVSIISSRYRQAFFSIVIYLSLFSFLIPQKTGTYGEETKVTSFTGHKYYRNYSYLEYDHHPQNLCIAQDKNGVIYFGNNAGLLIYDGITWKPIKIPNNLVQSMAFAADGRIYIGGNGEFGYLAPDNKGFLVYVSLKDHFDQTYGELSLVWNTVATPDGVYFRTSNLFFRWNYEKIDRYEKGTFRSLALCHDILLLQKSDVGLMKVDKNSMTLLPGGEAFDGKKTWMLTPFDPQNDPGSFLLGTWAKGLSIYRNGTVTPFFTEVDNYLLENKISHGIRLSSGDFAVATTYGGIVILDRQGRLKYIFNKDHGLQDNTVKAIFEDYLGNLWLALSKGISRLEYGSPFFHYDDRDGLNGMANSVSIHKGSVYVGTMQGLFVQHSAAGKFTPVRDIGSCWEILSTGQTVLAAAANGLFQVDNPDAAPLKIDRFQTFRVNVSNKFPGYVWRAWEKGLAALSFKDNRWSVAYNYKEIDIAISNIAEDPSGFLWLISSVGNIIKVEFPFGIDRPAVKPCNLENKLCTGDIYLNVAAGHVLFASNKGLFCYDEKTGGFIPDLILGKEYAYGPEGKPVFRITQNNDRNIWFESESINYRAIPGPGNSFIIEGGPFRRLPLAQVNAIYPGDDGRYLWFAGAEGLSRYDRRAEFKWDREFPALIRNVFCNVDTAVLGGYRNNFQQDESLALAAFTYDNRNISFFCGAPFFEGESNLKFSYMLEGYSDKWSEWTPESRKHFTNLDAGQYTFRVRAKNIYDFISKEDSLSFKILPPWYRTWWAFLLFAIVFSIGFFLLINNLVKRRSLKLMHEKEKLEQVVIERTREIRDKNEQLEQQTLQLREQSEKLKEMDEVKSRFFANISHEFRTPLTLIMSPLQQLLSRTRMADEWHKKSYGLMLRNSQQLLTLINRLLDLARFDSGKMKLQAAYQDIVPFLKTIIVSFQGLAEQKNLKIKSFDQTFSKGGWQPQPIKEMPPAGPPEARLFLYFDAPKMEEVMTNLLSNAIKFTPPGGEIIVSVEVEADRFARVSMKDTGIGIPAEQLNNIFDRFFQAGKPKDRVGQGTGIGLSLVKEIVSLHHGTIDVHSIEGKGTEFIIRLPLGKDHLGADEIFAGQVNVSASKDHRKETDDMLLEPGDEPMGMTAGKTKENDNVESREKTVILV